MAYDPLSRSTRKARASLIGFSATAYIVTFYDVTIEDIPGPGFKIGVNGDILSPFIFFAILYFLISFVIGYYEDYLYADVPETRNNRAKKEFLEIIAMNEKDRDTLDESMRRAWSDVLFDLEKTMNAYPLPKINKYRLIIF